MRKNTINSPLWSDYLRYPKEGFPRKIYWEVIAGDRSTVSRIQMYDVVFDEKDLKTRKLG